MTKRTIGHGQGHEMNGDTIFTKKGNRIEFRAMNEIAFLNEHIKEIERKLGYSFKNKKLLLLAFTHRSFINENPHVHEHNERLEFLGDSILGLIISEHLYRQLPHLPEGELSYLRSRLVEASSCRAYVQKLGVEPYLLLGRGERMNDGKGRETIQADLFEALIGAIYLDEGMESVKKFFFDHFANDLEQTIDKPQSNWKASLQDYCQKKYQKAPFYQLIDESGPDHNKIFKISVVINGQLLGNGEGSSKKEAQQAAAKNALERLE